MIDLAPTHGRLNLVCITKSGTLYFLASAAPHTYFYLAPGSHTITALTHTLSRTRTSSGVQQQNEWQPAELYRWDLFAGKLIFP